MNNNSPNRINLLGSNNAVLKSNNLEVKKDISEDTSLHLGLLANPAKIKNNGLGNFDLTSDTTTESSDTKRSSTSSDDSTTSRRRTTTTKQDVPSFSMLNQNQIPIVLLLIM